MRAQSRGVVVGRWVTGAAAAVLLAGLAVGPAQAEGRGSGGVVKPVKPISGCSARLQGDRAQARWTNVAYQTGEFQVGESAASSVRRVAGTGRLSQHAVGFDGRDAEGLWLSHATVGYDLDAGELLATRAPYPAKTADDVDRPGFSVGWSTRAIVGGVNEWNAYPYATDAAAYGAYGAENSVALVRVGPYVVPVDPWTPVSQEGSRATREVRGRLERGRQEWLRERGFVGQVRTFVNDAVGLDASRARGSEAQRVDRPVAKFVGVSRTSDAPAMSDSMNDAKSDLGQRAEASEASREKDSGASESGVKLSEAPGASAVIHLNQKPITRISLPHVAGLKNAGTRVVERQADEPAKDVEK